MVDLGYDSGDDPYLYKDVPVLINKRSIKNQDHLETFENFVFQGAVPGARDSLSRMPVNLSSWQEVHRICFEDVYEWAGQLRTVRISKGNTQFCYPEHVRGESKKIFACMNGITGLNDQDAVLRNWRKAIVI